MDATKLSKLDAKLRELFESNKQTEAKREKRKNQPGTGSIIRRRKGKEDKRIAV